MSASALRDQLQQIAEADGSLQDFFAQLHQAPPVTIPGDAFAQAARDYAIGLDFLPYEDLIEVRSNGDKIIFLFDFGGDDGRRVGFGGNRYHVLADGTLTVRQEASRTLWIADGLLFDLGPQGIRGVRKGDIQVQVGIFWPNVHVHTTERSSAAPLRDEKGDPVLLANADGEPVVRDGDYVVERRTDWLVTRVLGREAQAALRPLNDPN